MKNNNSNARAVNLVKIEEEVSIKKRRLENIKTLLSATAGKLSLLKSAIDSGMECFCSGSTKDGAVSLLDDIEASMYSGIGILEGKEE